MSAVNVKRVCPVHRGRLIGSKTKYGLRYACPEPDCSVVCWSGSTSTAADLPTREARQRAHAQFDFLWQSGRYKRNVVYQLLSEYMQLSRKQTHIGMFDIEQCQRVLEFCQQQSGKTSLIIIGAAIRDDQGKVHSVPIPGRHHDVIRQMRASGYTGSVQGDRQGFLLSNGQFATREAAEPIARAADQLGRAKLIGSVLTSEDLW